MNRRWRRELEPDRPTSLWVYLAVVLVGLTFIAATIWAVAR